ncbi:unnamed protein product [Pleuronectes platessa]|uniref:Uncharacterized protein n=1 Tax=Pleuronectes platessa TaxID=8262 RepID=A0A9N7TRJ4_PLEPL|nr:unnamed protein product [Pleuronectes platessa]
MSWEANGGGQLRGRMKSGGTAHTASSYPMLCALQPGERLTLRPLQPLSKWTTSPDLRVALEMFGTALAGGVAGDLPLRPSGRRGPTVPLVSVCKLRQGLAMELSWLFV